MAVLGQWQWNSATGLTTCTLPHNKVSPIGRYIKTPCSQSSKLLPYNRQKYNVKQFCLVHIYLAIPYLFSNLFIRYSDRRSSFFFLFFFFFFFSFFAFSFFDILAEADYLVLNVSAVLTFEQSPNMKSRISKCYFVQGLTFGLRPTITFWMSKCYIGIWAELEYQA